MFNKVWPQRALLGLKVWPQRAFKKLLKTWGVQIFDLQGAII